MKKKEKPRRLTLNRETIQVLDDPALLERARGGQPAELVIGGGTTHGPCTVITNMNGG